MVDDANTVPSSGEFTLDDANELRRAIGESVRASRLAEPHPEGQLEALGYLARDGAQSIASLARLRRIRHQSMSATVAELENRGLVSRAADPADARGVLVSITAAGAEVIRQSRIDRSTRLKNAADQALSPDERALLVGTAALLDRLVEALRAQ
ncbi:MarR family winged helix-turn-helix transcriptional regulator [Frondihabitans australicus]|uniref:Winged helix DNA-binding protein n=1 Tax=Frondihabitans australicus TaxID=386892 RepID=A0A495ILH9_9MICO|nr:MarR family transcriptional regulator [Frondihabitans australicus]RKR75985.1 winged helix DNA-binding protein [Frondihabitans australicus]